MSRPAERGRGLYNVVVLGGGTAGLVTAAGTAGLGGRVALVERGRMGGDCLNTGCVPSKALVAAAREARTAARHAARIDFAAVMDRVRERRAALAPHDSAERFESLGVDVFAGAARFVSPHEVAVGEVRLRARTFVIATGSRPVLPPIDGLADAAPYTNETLFDALRARPEGLVVLGGGPIGCELGQAFARLGVRVTLLEAAPRILDKEDPDVAEVVRAALAADGVDVRTGVTVRRVARAAGRTRLELDEGTVEGEALLVAAGRAPNLEGLGLEAAGVASTPKGVTVDARLRTSQRHILAAGDVTGSYQFTHLADHHARVCVRNILTPWFPAKVDTRVLPWCTFTDPEVGRVGTSEAEARKAGLAVDVWRQPMDGVDRAVVEGETAGFVKVLTAKGTDRILGGVVVGARGGDLVHEIALAMKVGAGLRALGGTIHAYPTFADAIRRTADAHQRARLTPRAQSVFRWLYRRQRRERG